MLSRKTICLNMIVKNESHIISKTLGHLHEIFNFDYWVICDTGSTDNTIELIESFFEKKGIPGELVTHQWEGFGVCRTYALNCAYNKSDYLLIFDADDEINGKFELPDNGNLTKDKYYLKSGNKDIIYYRPLLINNTMRWCFKGVLHEYLENIDKIQNGEQYIDGEYYIKSCGTGSRSINPNKYYEDGLLLERYIETEKDDGLRSRYIYYCGQSFFDANEYVKSIEYYKKALSHNCWYQEKYVACMRIGDILNSLQNITEAIIYWDGASQFEQTRLECIEKIIRHFYGKGNHRMVMYYYNKYKHISQITDTSGYLLINTNSYNWIRYFACISAYYVNDTLSGYNCCKYLILNYINIDEINVFINLSFYIHEFDNDVTNDVYRKKLLVCIFNKMKQYINVNNNFVKRLWDYIHTYLKTHIFELYQNGVEMVLSII